MDSKLIMIMILFFLLNRVESSNYTRGCYYTSWAHYRTGEGKYTPENYVPGLCTHIFYAFAVMNQDFTMKTFELGEETMYKSVTDLRNLQPDLKVLISFGGYTFSQGNLQLLSSLVSSSENRATFIKSAIDFVRQNNFDGFDIDYEYPDGSVKTNLGVLATEMKAAFEKESQSTGKPCLLLTAAVSAGIQKIDEGYDVPALGQALDFINIMTYDFHGSWEQVTGMNSPLYDRNGDQLAMSNAINHWVDLGAPKEKILVGLAAYGRGWTLNDENNFQVGAPANAPSQWLPYSGQSGMATYYEVCDFLEKGADRYEDDQQKVPFMVSGNQWIGYDDVWSFDLKLNWIKENGFGGAFTWALDLDDFSGICKSSNGQKFPLHTAILNAFTKNSASGSNITTTARPTTTKKPTTTPSPLKTTSQAPGPIPTICPPSGILANPNDCSSFYQCGNGRMFLKKCPSGLLFNKNLLYCDWPTNVKC